MNPPAVASQGASPMAGRYRSWIFWYGVLLLGWLVLACVPRVARAMGDAGLPPSEIPIVNGLWLAGHLVLMIGYVGLLVGLNRGDGRAISLGRVIVFAAPFYLAMILTAPIGSADIYHYSFYARIMNHYGANPYMAAIADFPQDPFTAWTVPHWRTSKGGYGPLLMGVLVGVDWLGGGDFHRTALGTRILMAIAVLSAAWIVGVILRGDHGSGRGSRWTAALAFNPLLCFEAANNGHSDALVVLFFVLAYGALVRRNHGMVMPLLALSFLVKPVALIAAPFVLRHQWQVGDRRSAIRGSLSAVIVIVGAYAVFYPFNPLGQIVPVNLPGAWWFHMGPVPMVLDLSLGRVPTHWLQGIYVIGWCVCFFMVRVDTVERLAGVTVCLLGGYLALCGTWVMSWYLLWLLPLPLFMRSNAGLGIVAVVTLTGVLAYFIPMGILALVLTVMAVYARVRGATLFVDSA